MEQLEQKAGQKSKNKSRRFAGVIRIYQERQLAHSLAKGQTAILCSRFYAKVRTYTLRCQSIALFVFVQLLNCSVLKFDLLSTTMCDFYSVKWNLFVEVYRIFLCIIVAFLKCFKYNKNHIKQ